jgi:hypothetical protein
VKKTVSLPATPLTDPEKFGIPVRNATRHHSKTSSSAKKKLNLNTSRSSEDNSLASPADQVTVLAPLWKYQMLNAGASPTTF